MCSINEDSENLEFQSKEKIIITESDLCRKCRYKKPDVILREKDFYCYSCFSEYFVHKFRSTIGKSKMIRHGDEVLVAFSGGFSSSVMLHLIHDGIEEHLSSKRLRFIPSVLVVDESAMNVSSSSSSMPKIHEEVLRLNFPLYHTSLEEVMRDKSENIDIKAVDAINPLPSPSLDHPRKCQFQDDIKKLLHSDLRSQTSRQNLAPILRNELICRCAQQLGFQKIFLGDSASNLAIRILSDVALGRGAHLADHVNFKTELFGTEIYRPMRELFEDEIRYYVQARDISVPSPEGDMSQDDGKPSIISCTKNFVSELQKNFVSTIPTIFRTGGKLVSGTLPSSQSTSTRTSISEPFQNSSTPGFTESDFDTCAVCGSNRDTRDGVSALEAVKFSKQISRGKNLGVSELLLEGSGVDESGIDKLSIEDATEDDVYSYLCYGCANLLEEMGSAANFPPRIQERMESAKQKNRLKVDQRIDNNFTEK